MKIHRAVLDTNVMVSVAFAKEGLAKELRDMIADGAFTLVTSKEIVKELYRVFHYPHIVKRFKPSERDINEFIGMILSRAIITKGLFDVKKIKDDPTDNKFLACALEGKADYIVSRDPHLRDLKYYQGIQIADVKTFTEKMTGK
ncbi:MAG: putative toxin-antitoxin system toxin component, PIN family [Deltaproteobacteria bacterium]|nr:putative toxin-antitoxin system toxin component, PIN family [Deltaproteobacteria bacterium]